MNLMVLYELLDIYLERADYNDIVINQIIIRSAKKYTDERRNIKCIDQLSSFTLVAKAPNITYESKFAL